MLKQVILGVQVLFIDCLHIFNGHSVPSGSLYPDVRDLSKGKHRENEIALV